MPIFGNPAWYYQKIRKYTTVFGSYFANITVSRLNKTNTVIQTLDVPINYAPKEKWLARLAMDPTLTRSIEIQLPAISFEMTGVSYDGDRKKAPLTKEIVSSIGFKKSQFSYAPVPWNLHFSLYIYVKNADDGCQILEQILPFFAPEWTSTISLFAGAAKLDIPTVLNTISMEDSYEGGFATRRALIWTLHFTMKAFLYGPAKTVGIIKKAQTDLYTALNADLAEERIIITPGLLANGQPTTNSAASININLISANDHYGVCVDFFDLTDGQV